MNTQDYIDSIKQKNLEKAKLVLKMRFGNDLNKLKELYTERSINWNGDEILPNSPIHTVVSMI